MKKDMVVVGLDGACWTLINEWVEDGELPNIKKLKEGGCWGDLQSCIPPITSPAWKCYSTGKNPGKLGVFWWENLDLSNMKAITPSSKSFKSKELWDYLNEHGISTGVIGMPTTYPPKEINGFMVAGGPECMNQGYSYPQDIEKELKKELDYKTNIPLTGIYTNEQETVNEALNLIELQFKAAKHLTKKSPVDFLQVTTFHINGLFQHFFYQGEPVKEAWKLVDRCIGDLMENFNYIILMSDHGTSPMEKNFFINAWLIKEGYLVKKMTPYDFLLKIGISREMISSFLNKMHIKNFLRRFKIAKKINTQIPTMEGDFGHHSGDATLERAELTKTRVVGSPQGPLYINKGILEDEREYEELRDELTNKLERIRDPETGKKVIEKVYKKEEIYWGKYLKYAPDLIALDSDEYHNRGGILKQNLFEKSEWEGNNSRYGLFVFYGPEIKEHFKLDGVTIFDLAPTILHIFDIPIPEDMDGRVLNEIFKNGNELAERKIKYRLDKTDEKKRIRSIIKKIKSRDIDTSQ